VLQVVSGYSPLASGLALLPLTVIMLALSARSGETRGPDRLAAFTITKPPHVPRPAGVPAPEQCLHCGLDAPPLTISVSQMADAE
jgi:hypothetical protein